MVDKKESDSPVLLLGISLAYSSAFDLLWEAKLRHQNPSEWDIALILHPVCHLLGVSMEVTLKGLLSCRQRKIPRKHNLCELIRLVADARLEAILDAELSELPVPDELFVLNDQHLSTDVEACYRRHPFHLEMLNRMYDTPFATRYPVLGGHALPDVAAIRLIIMVLQLEIQKEVADWRPE